MRLPSLDDIPEDRFSLTQFLRKNYPLLENLKRKGAGEKRAWLYRLGEAICNVGVYEGQLSPEQIGATIFVINRLFHEHVPGTETLKTQLQTLLIKRTSNRRDCKVNYVRSGPYKGTYLLRIGVWGTHIPAKIYNAACPREKAPPRQRKASNKRRAAFARRFHLAYAH